MWAYCKACMVQTEIDETTGMCKQGHKAYPSAFQKARDKERQRQAREKKDVQDLVGLEGVGLDV